MNKLEEYGSLFSKLGLTELSVKEGEFELTLKKECVSATPVNVTPVNVEVQSEASAVSQTGETTEAGLEIKSPLVGVFGSGEESNGKPYVQVGDIVRKGDIVCTIEAMKMINDVSADKDGVIKEICVKNGGLVEYQQTLFKLDPIV